MNKLTKFLTATTVAAFLSTPSHSGEGMTGLSIGVVGMESEFTTVGKEIRGSTGALVGQTQGSVTGSGEIIKDVDIGSVFIEYTQAEGIGMMTMGLEYIPGEAEIGTKSRTDDNEVDTDDGTYTAKAEVSDYISAYVEPGFVLADWLGIYGKVGVSSVKVDTLESIDIGSDSSSYGDKRIYGGMLGLGIKVQSPWGIFVKAEATRNRYQKIKMKSTTGNKNTIEAQPEMDAVRFALGFNF